MNTKKNILMYLFGLFIYKAALNCLKSSLIYAKNHKPWIQYLLASFKLSRKVSFPINVNVISTFLPFLRESPFTNIYINLHKASIYAFEANNIW